MSTIILELGQYVPLPKFLQFGAKCPWGILSFGAKCLLANKQHLTTKLAQYICFFIPHQNRNLKYLSRPDTWGLDTATPSSRLSSTMVAAFCNQNYAANLICPLSFQTPHSFKSPPHYFWAISIAYFSFELRKNTPSLLETSMNNIFIHNQQSHCIPFTTIKHAHARRNYKEAATWPPAQPPQPSLVSARPPPGLFVSALLYWPH